MSRTQLLKAKEAAELLNISPQQLYKLSWAKKLSRVKIGGGYRWPLNGLEEYIRANTVEASR